MEATQITGLSLFQNLLPLFTDIQKVWLSENSIINNFSIGDLTALTDRAELFIKTTIPINDKSNVCFISGLAEDKLLSIIHVLDDIRGDKQKERVDALRNQNSLMIQRLEKLMLFVKVGDRVELNSRFLDGIPPVLRNMEACKRDKVEGYTPNWGDRSWRERRFTVVGFNLENGQVTLTPGKQMVGEDLRTQKEKNFKVEFTVDASDIISTTPKDL